MAENWKTRDKHRILCDRAAVLAKPLPQTDTSEQLQIIEFTLGSEWYGIELACAEEVRELSSLTPLPDTPPHIAGVIAVRGHIVSVLDLRTVLDLPPTSPAGTEKVIILRRDSMEFGLLVDRVSGIKDLPVTQILAPLPTLHGRAARYVRGVTASSVIVLDGGSILADKDLVVDQTDQS